MKQVMVIMLLTMMFGFGFEEFAFAESDPFLNTPKMENGQQYPIMNFAWDADGFWGRFDPVYNIANVLFVVAVFLLQLSIFFLNLGFEPSQWLSPVLLKNISDAIQNSHFLERIWPFFILVAGGVLIKDLYHRNYQATMKRASVFAVAAISLLLFQGIGTERYLNIASAGIDSVSHAVPGWILSFRSTDQMDSNAKTFEDKNQSFNAQIWKILIQNPWELGELGQVDLKVTEEDVSKLPSGVDAKANVTYWREILLPHPVGSDTRKDLASILNDESTHPEAKSAFFSSFRFLISLMALLGVVCSAVFFIIMGIYLLFAHLMLLAVLVAAIFILPISLLPWAYSEKMLHWLVKSASGSILVKIGIGAYVGITFLGLSLIS